MTNDENDPIERAARDLRIKLGIDDQLRPDMITVVVKMKHQGLIEDYARHSDDEMPDAEAFFDPDSRVLHLRESTFCAANALYTYSESERRRARYTIAHEIGHVALGHDGRHYRGDINETAKKLEGQVQKNEREAERFAAAFLAPAHLA